jgi:hypothetical protein
MGNGWWEEKYITNYALVKNLPDGLFDVESEFDPTALFASDYFEWQQQGWHRLGDR